MDWLTSKFEQTFSRRQFLKSTVAVALSLGLSPWKVLGQGNDGNNQSATMNTRAIPGSGENLPVVGLGTWQQFDVDLDPRLLKPLKRVLGALFESGGSVIDTSPMYGRAQQVLGKLLTDQGRRSDAFIATKVWTRGKQSGIDQMNDSMDKLNVEVVDLIQVHNLVDWRTHLETLRDWKDNGKIRYHGVTHYTGSAFDELANIMKNVPIDFVQLPYSIGFRRAEERLLPLAREQEIAVLVNRPFRAGSLFRQAQEKSLPDWASELGINTWAQYFLKYILGHPAVTTVIPGTSDPDHMLDNARAGTGPMPNATQRKEMVKYWTSL